MCLPDLNDSFAVIVQNMESGVSADTFSNIYYWFLAKIDLFPFEIENFWGVKVAP